VLEAHGDQLAGTDLAAADAADREAADEQRSFAACAARAGRCSGGLRLAGEGSMLGELVRALLRAAADAGLHIIGQWRHGDRALVSAAASAASRAGILW
jgi:hypothetical protein